MKKYSNLKIGLISDGKYGQRAFENIKKVFNTQWIEVPDIPSNIMLDDDFELTIPECDLYISYARHPDIILEIAMTRKPLILGVLPGIGLYKQARSYNPRVIYVPTMCSLEGNLGISEIDEFTKHFGKPIFVLSIDANGKFEKIELKRSSVCGSSDAGAKFLEGKQFNENNLQEFALSICHECRAPRFGHTCDKEVAGINHLVSLFNSIPDDKMSQFQITFGNFINNIKKEYENRMNSSRKILEQVV